MSSIYDLFKAINTRWSANNLDEQFKRLWTNPLAEFEALIETEAKPKTPWPYCVFESGTPRLIERTTHATEPSKKIRISSLPWQFRVHAKSKSQANDLAQLIIAAFEGFRPTNLATSRDDEWFAKEDDAEWLCVIPYGTIFESEYTP